MNEPNYEFVKGTGWVLTKERRELAIDANGKKIWIIDRVPTPDECYINMANDNSYWTLNNQANFEPIVKHIAACQWRFFPKYGTNTNHLQGYFHVVTLIPYEP